MGIVDAECSVTDGACQLGFLRGLCATYWQVLDICDDQIFRRALRKEPDGCIPGQRWCLGFQEIFGGPIDEECYPWNFNCTMYDYFVAGGGRD